MRESMLEEKGGGEVLTPQPANVQDALARSRRERTTHYPTFAHSASPSPSPRDRLLGDLAGAPNARPRRVARKGRRAMLWMAKT